MLLLLNTNHLTPKSPKTKKAILWRAKFQQLTSPLTPSQLATILPTAYVTYCGHIPNPTAEQALSSNSDTAEYSKTDDIQPLSPFRTIDIETSTTDLHPTHQADYIDQTPKPKRLTETEIFNRLKPYAHTAQHSDSSTPADLRYHTHLCFNRNTNVDQSWSIISSIFPETCIPNYVNNIKTVVFNLNRPFILKPLYIDKVSKSPKQKMYVSNALFASNLPDDLISMGRNADHTDHLDTANPTNLLRHSLIEAYKQSQIDKHGSLKEAKAYYLKYGDSIDPQTPLYDKHYNLMGTIQEVILDPAHNGKSCNYGANPDWYNPTYGTQQTKREYLQVAQNGGYITDHVNKSRVTLKIEDLPDHTITTDEPYIGDHFIIDQDYAYGLIAPTGSGKTYSFRNKPNHILLVPQNKQVKAERDGFTVVLSEEQALNTPDSYTSIEEAIKDGHTTLVMTYDKFAGHLSKKDRTYLKPFTIVCDEIHEFLLSAKTYNQTRDSLFQSFRAKQYRRLVFMSATLKPRFFKDITPMSVTRIETKQHRPETHIVSGLDYEDFIYRDPSNYQVSIGSFQKGLASIIDNETKTVVWINHINAGRGIIKGTSSRKTTAHIYGKSENSPADIIASAPDLLVLTSAVKQGFSINYPVDTYIVYIDPLNNFNTYTLDEIEQITARCRNARKLIIVVSPKRYYPLYTFPVPTQEEVIEGGILVKEGRTVEEVSAMFMSGYASLLDNAIVESDESMPSFYLSERVILGNRVLQSSIADSFNLTRPDLQVNGVGCIVHPIGSVIHEFPKIKDSYELTSLILYGDSLKHIEKRVEDAFFPDGLLLSAEPKGLNTIESTLWKRFESTLSEIQKVNAELRKYDKPELDLDTMKIILVKPYAWTGFRGRERIKTMKGLILPDDGQLLSVSTLPRLWNNKDPAIKKLGGARKMTTSKTIKVLKNQLHQEAVFVVTLEDGTTRDLKELKWSKKNQAKYDPSYKGAKRKDATIGWLHDETFLKAKKEDDGVYPIGGKVLFINKGYLL